MSKNYILNGDIKFGTRGYTAYQDAAVSRPVDGTGGTPTVSVSVSPVDALVGDSSLLFTKPSSNVQGQGFSTDFIIDAADQAKPLQVSFDWGVESGVFTGSVSPATDSDVIVYLYDIDNAALIEPAGRLLEPAIDTQRYRYRGTFQPSFNGRRYRLIYHIATTTTNGFTLRFDDIRVGPQVVSNGAAVTDWQSYTPTGSWTTNTTYTGLYRRVGSDIEAQVKVLVSGAPNAAGLTVNLPPGLSFATNNLIDNGTNFEGTGETSTSRAGGAGYKMYTVYESSTSVRLAYQSTTGALGANVTNTAPYSPGAGNYYLLRFKGPIAGWSSNVQMSNDTDTRVVSFVASKGSGQAITANVTNITFANILKDTHGAWVGPDTYRVPVSGDYYVSTSGGSSPAVNISVWKNGVNTGFILTGFASDKDHNGSLVISDLRAGDLITLRGNQSVTINNQSLTISRISGPSQIAASETVSASRTQTSGQSIPNNTATIMTLNNNVYDTHNAMASNGDFIAPVAGVYRFTATCSFNANITGIRIIELQKNGSSSEIIRSPIIIPVSGVDTRLAVSGSFHLLAGDKVNVIVFQTSGGNLSLLTAVTYNRFMVERVA